MPSRLAACLLLAVLSLSAQAPLVINTPMPPPEWALLERELLHANSAACDRFAARYLDPRGYLLHTPRWGTLDGPDDAIETFWNWPLLHALGGSDALLDHYRRAQEGHWRQYGELHTKLTKLAENGAYHKEFVTQSDWFHTGEGMRAFFFLGLSQPDDPLYQSRMKRFAGLYMNEDPEAPNYDPDKKIIRSIWNGAQGPMLRKATVYDWVGDPVPGRFHLLHNAAGRGQMLDLEKWYPRMLAHCAEYLDSAGDNFLNLAATNLALNAFLLTGEQKYKTWLVDYVDAWNRRAAECGGNIPSNVGLDGTPGGEHKGQWWKGTYGWNFTIFDGELEKTVHRNYLTGQHPVGDQPRDGGPTHPDLFRLDELAHAQVVLHLAELGLEDHVGRLGLGEGGAGGRDLRRPGDYPFGRRIGSIIENRIGRRDIDFPAPQDKHASLGQTADVLPALAAVPCVLSLGHQWFGHRGVDLLETARDSVVRIRLPVPRCEVMNGFAMNHRRAAQTKPTAAECYSARHAEAQSLLKLISRRLEEHKAKQAKEPLGLLWGDPLDQSTVVAVQRNWHTSPSTLVFRRWYSRRLIG